MNENEVEVAKRYEAEGYSVIRGGAPDFLCVRVVSGEIVEAVFVEVKSSGRGLTYEQAIYRRVLESLGAKFVVVSVSPIHTAPFPASPSQAEPARTAPYRANSTKPKEVTS